MADLGDIEWPPAPIKTARLTLRDMEARDRDGHIELLSSETVRKHLGGPWRTRVELERLVPPIPRHPGVFAVCRAGAFIGSVRLDRRDPGRPGRLRPEGLELEVSYTFLPDWWGRGYAAESVAAALEWVRQAIPGEPVVLCTQVANARSVRLAEGLGFTERERFTEFDETQWFGVLAPSS